VSEHDKCNGTKCNGSKKSYGALTMPHSVGSETDTPPVTVPPLTIVGIRQMGDNKVLKLQKFHKARLVEAILTCMSRIDLFKLKDGTNDDSGRSSES
jgi:hypothetical protein